jgi:hypothetical protein
MKNYLKKLPLLAIATLVVLNCCKKKDNNPAPGGPSGNCQLTKITGKNYQYQITYNSNGQVDKFIQGTDTFYYQYTGTLATRIAYKHNNYGVYDISYDNQGRVSKIRNNNIVGTDSFFVEEYDVTYVNSKQATVSYTSGLFSENSFTGNVTFDSKMNPVTVSYSTNAKNDYVINMEYDDKANVTPFLMMSQFPFKVFVPANNLTKIYNITHYSSAKDSLLTTSVYTNSYSSNYLTNSVLKYNQTYSDSSQSLQNYTLSSDYSYNCK